MAIAPSLFPSPTGSTRLDGCVTHKAPLLSGKKATKVRCLNCLDNPLKVIAFLQKPAPKRGRLHATLGNRAIVMAFTTVDPWLCVLAFRQVCPFLYLFVCYYYPFFAVLNNITGRLLRFPHAGFAHPVAVDGSVPRKGFADWNNTICPRSEHLPDTMMAFTSK